MFVPLFWFVCRNFYIDYKPLFYAFTTFIVACFTVDVLYMELIKFDHTLHLSICITIAVMGFGFWVVWALFHLSSVPHSKFYLLTYISLGVGPLTAKYFEWFPPFYWTYDAHSIMHILSSPTPFIFWWTIAIDDVYLVNFKQKLI